MGVDTSPARQQLDRGRAAHAGRAWVDAYESLANADELESLGPADLELLATSAYMLGHDDEFVRGLERAHYGHLDAGETARAARCTWWIGLNLLLRGEVSPARGWFARGERMLDREQLDCAERGYFSLAHMLEHFAEGDFESARVAAAEALEIGERFAERDLVALGVMDLGHALLELGQTREGLRLVDESMVAVTSAELSPIVRGILYCNTIAVCRGVYEFRRAREWTTALTVWTDRERDMVAHKGVCLVHRAEILQLQGAWEAALDEIRDVEELGVLNGRAARGAVYLRGELHRLRGEHDAAEAAFRDVAARGGEPQPGLALLRLAQGKTDSALAAMRRVLGETDPPLERAALLPAHVEVALAAAEVAEAESASDELAAIASAQGSDALAAMSSCARGAVALERGDGSGALGELRRGMRVWQELEAPYEAARARMLAGRACALLGDDDGAALELASARAVFAELGAATDQARLETLLGRPPRDTHGLSARELEVLRLVAAGGSNKAIAGELVLSERTVERHVSNILRKVGVSSRSAATAYAYEHDLV